MEAYVTIELGDGRVLDEHVTSALGSVERPMSDADLEAKFHGQVDGLLAQERAAELVAACWGADQCADAAEIGRLTAAA